MLRSFSASVLVAALFCSCSTTGAPPSGDRLLVGAAAVDITPLVPAEPADGTKAAPVYMAGFGTNRTAQGVHDPLWARALVVEKGGRRLLLLSCDLVGLLHGRIREIAPKFDGDVVVCSTHCHSGPDVVGLWGPLPIVSGVSPAYLKRLKDALEEAARRALDSRRPATLHAAAVRVEGVCKDIRPPDIRNEIAPSLVARDDSGRAIAVLVSFAMHPEGMGPKNRLISSDYPHYEREALEREFPGAVAIHVSGDLGGMQTTDVKERSWEEIRRCGETIAARVAESQARASAVPVPEVRVRRAPVRFPMENKRFIAGFKSGLFGKDTADVVSQEGEDFVLTSEIVAVRLGEVVLVTIPGEALPEVGREILRLIDAPHKVLIGLGQDEIGYILPKEEFDPKKYEESMSLGPRTAPTLLDALNSLLKGF